MKDSHYQHHRVLETAIKSRGREAEESVLGDSPDMTIFSKNNIMCWPKIQNFVSGVSIDFYAFLGVIFGYFILIIAVLVGWQRYIILHALLYTYISLLLLQTSKW